MYRSKFVYGMLAVICINGSSLAQTAPSFASKVLAEINEPVWAIKKVQTTPGSAQEQIAWLTNPSTIMLYDSNTKQARVIYEGEQVMMTMTERPTLDAGYLSNTDAQDIVFSDAKKFIVLRQQDQQWQSDVLYDLTEFIGVLWGVRVGDLDADHPGDEVLGIIEGVFDTSFANMYSYSGGQWNETMIYAAEVGMDSAIGEFDPDHDGDEFVIATEMGPTYTLHAPPIGWDPSMNPPIEGFWGQVHWPIAKISDDIDNAGWAVKIGDVDRSVDGNEIVYGNRYNNKISVLSRNPDGSFDFQQVFQGNWVDELTDPFVIVQQEGNDGLSGPGNIWDIALGDVLPANPGDEIVGVDDTGSVYLVWNTNGEWFGDTIYQNPEPLFAVEIMDVDPATPGNEIVIGGASKQVIVLSQQLSYVHDWELLQ